MEYVLAVARERLETSRAETERNIVVGGDNDGRVRGEGNKASHLCLNVVCGVRDSRSGNEARRTWCMFESLGHSATQRTHGIL